jgi:GTP-binding protein Era
LADADINIFVVDALTWTDEDAQVLEYLKRCGRPIILAINKIDKVYPKERLLPFMQEMLLKSEFALVLPISGLKRDGLQDLPKLLAPLLPLSPPLFPEEQITDRSDQFRAAEIVREKLTWQTHQELPYGITVEIERFEIQEDGRLLINAIIWVERPGQKAIIIGQGGERLKEIGTAARRELKYLFKRSVHLELWVKVKENWSDSEAALRQFGFE